MGTTPVAPVAVNQPPRELTQGEVQRLVNDAWVQMNMRLTPGKLHTNCFFRVEDYVRKNFKAVIPAVKATVWTNYQEAVRLLADGYFRAVKALFYEPNCLEWIVEHPALAKRRQLELENRGLGRQPDANEFDVAAKNQATEDKAKADKIEKDAQKDVDIAIDKILFTDVRGLNNRKTDELRAELRAYVATHKGKKKWSEILGYVIAKIASAYKAHEKAQEQWNSR